MKNSGAASSFTGFVRRQLTGHRSLAYLLVFLKSFLLHGAAETKRKMRQFREVNPTYRTLSRIMPYLSNSVQKKNAEKERGRAFPRRIKISITVPLYNTPERFLREMISSVRAQTYTDWELCLADGSDSQHMYVGDICRSLSAEDGRIVYKKLVKNGGISENTNECIRMASGDYIALFDHDDLLHPSALYYVMCEICENNADFIYTDEVTFSGKSIHNIGTCHLKPDYAPDNLRANNYICHFSVFSAGLLEKAGMFRPQYDGSQDHDIILRLTAAAVRVSHIPKVLYFWRSHKNSVAMDINSKAYAINAGINAVHDFLISHGFPAKVESSVAFPTIYHIAYELKEHPLVSVIITGHERAGECAQSVLKQSVYDNYEIIISGGCVDAPEDGRVRLIPGNTADSRSLSVNRAVKEAKGKYILLLDSMTEVISPDFVEQLLQYVQREDVAAAGGKTVSDDGKIRHGGIILGFGAQGIAGYSHFGTDSAEFGYMGRMFYSQDVSAVSTSCMMLRRSDFEALGGLDTALDRTAEIDLCIRLHGNGRLIVFNPYCVMNDRAEKESGDNITYSDSEAELFRKKYKDILSRPDPYYNPNLSLSYSYGIKTKP